MNEQAVDVLRSPKKALLAAGGEERVGEQHQKGKLTARERVRMLFDVGSFVETQAFAEGGRAIGGFETQHAPGEGVITGFGTVDGRPIHAFMQDFTVMGGSLGVTHAQKIVRIMDMALKTGTPLVAVLDSGGARLQEGAAALDAMAAVCRKMGELSGAVPVLSIVAGPCAGSAAFLAALSDFVFMAEHAGALFTSGPMVFSAITGRDYTAEELGGARVHNETTGCAHFFCAYEADCFAKAKRLLSFLPSNNAEDAPVCECADDLNRRIGFDTEKYADVRALITEMADCHDFLEIMPLYAPDMAAGFLRLNGWNAGVLANAPGMRLKRDACEKAARFVRFCDAFHIPLVVITDTDGFVVDAGEELAGLVRHGAKLVFAFAQSGVPVINIITGNAVGAGFVAMCGKSLGADLVYAWPNAFISPMQADAAASLLLSDKIMAADDPVAERKKQADEYASHYASPFEAAKQGFVDDVILPSETRQRVIAALELLVSKRAAGIAKKHGNMPL